MDRRVFLISDKPVPAHCRRIVASRFGVVGCKRLSAPFGGAVIIGKRRYEVLERIPITPTGYQALKKEVAQLKSV